MKLVHKSLSIHPDIWKKLRVNAELSGVPSRDFLALLIDRSTPVEVAGNDRLHLQRISELQRAARAATT